MENLVIVPKNSGSDFNTEIVDVPLDGTPGRSVDLDGDASSLSSEATRYEFMPFREVKRGLEGWQILFIAVSGIVGMGLFDNSGLVLGIAGPSGSILSYGLVGAGVICVMEGVSEMIGHWPISNAMVEFVRSFVDEELATIVGFAYCFATLIVGAANLAQYWDWPNFYQSMIFIFFLPLILLVLNCLGVKYYGNVESIAGILKLFLVFAAFVTMLVINGGDIQDQFQNNPTIASTAGIATLVGIPIAAYAYAGVEIVAVTAVEAKDPRSSLRFPAQWIAYITAFIYLFSVIVLNLNISWTDVRLPSLTSREHQLNIDSASPTNTSTAIVILAVKDAGLEHLAGFFNVCLILAILSAANTSLYVSSRTLFGLGKEWNSAKWYHRLGTTHPGNKVPVWALLASTLAFCWIPFVHLGGTGYTNYDVQEIMSGLATVIVVLVWASQCLAFIRYYWWLSIHRPKLRGEAFKKFDRWSHSNPSAPFSSRGAYIQPIPAIFGLVGCILTVFLFSTASWWNGGEDATAVVAVWIAPISLFILWLLLKAYNRRLHWGTLYVHLSDNWTDLKDELLRLNGLIYDEEDNEPPGAIGRFLGGVGKSVGDFGRSVKGVISPFSVSRPSGGA
ncbi:hypothetical protein G7Y89_g4002 [Cudoniella acicularis]|uniref:Amino acid permease/ SLC12A domain-containing protein n=1 Tax=Cudoniella acicularis TaxID=354080 RepID=A0A8H4W746_9HELO|nr:hypothetical protein G7Y89_g4002 [Cudoniella acicularis]